MLTSLPVLTVRFALARVRRVGCWALLAAGCAGNAGGDLGGDGVSESRQPIVYGSDDRVEVVDYDSPRLAAMMRRRVGALIPDYSVLPDGDGYRIIGPTLAETGICPDEPHAQQLAVSGCTALRLSEDRIVTAGHCFTSGWLTDVFFVTGYWLGADYPKIRAEDVHEVDEVLIHVDGELEVNPSADYAVARLTRPIVDDGVEIELAKDLPSQGESVIVAGTSEGLPLKVDDGASVIRRLGTRAFELTSDTFVGGSGSPVFDREGALRGMVVGGGADYELDEAGNCLRPRVVEGTPDTAEIAVAASVLEAALEADGRLREESCALAGLGRQRSPSAYAFLLVLVAAALCRRRSGLTL